MKKRNLPFSFLLIFIVLGGILFSSYALMKIINPFKKINLLDQKVNRFHHLLTIWQA